MNRKYRKTLEALFAHPVRGNIPWRDIEALFRELGAEISERQGSRVAVVLFGEVRVFHRPHPSPDTDKGAGGEHPELVETAWSPTMNIMTLDDYRAKIEYDPELDLFRGEILGLNGGADFYGRNPEELRAEFKKSLAVFLEVCREKGLEPRRQYSGRFNLRIPPELHERLATVAQAEGKSINGLAQEALRRMVL